MPPRSPTNPDHALWVEGPTDEYFLYQFCNRRGLDNRKRFTVKIGSNDADGGWTQLRDALPVAVRARYQTVAAIFDADAFPGDRWRAVTGPLRHHYPTIPEVAPTGGFAVGGAPGYPRLGLWMMPDNSAGGMLEDFCRSLVPEADGLLLHAEDVLDELPETRFTRAHRAKALLHSWLSWQSDPGLSLGHAMMSGLFDHQRASATSLAAWIETVFPGVSSG